MLGERLVVKAGEHHVAADLQSHLHQVPADQRGVVVHLAEDRVRLRLVISDLAERGVQILELRPANQ